MQGGEPQAQQQVGACWIASYPDGALRLGARGWRRFRQRLPVVPWLQNRLVALGGPNFDSQHLRELGGGHRWSRGGASGVTETVPVFGLARILPGKHQPSLPGDLQPGNPELSVLDHYFCRPLDGTVETL